MIYWNIYWNVLKCFATNVLGCFEMFCFKTFQNIPINHKKPAAGLLFSAYNALVVDHSEYSYLLECFEMFCNKCFGMF